MNEDALKIEVTGKTDAIPLVSFLEIIGSTLAALQDIDAALSQAENATLDWKIVEARMNSPFLLTI